MSTTNNPAGFRDITNTTPAPPRSSSTFKRKKPDENSTPALFSRFSATPAKKSKSSHSTSTTPLTAPSTPIHTHIPFLINHWFPQPHMYHLIGEVTVHGQRTEVVQLDIWRFSLPYVQPCFAPYKTLPIEIVDLLWIKSPDSRIATGTGKSEAHLMYGLDVPCQTIKSFRPAITSFAAQTVESRVVLRKGAHHRLEMLDIGASTLTDIGEGRVRMIAQVRQIELRPVELVRINTLSPLNFARNREARLLPLLKGLLYFAHSAASDLFAYNSHLGEMPSYSTVYQAACQLGQHQKSITYQRGRDPAIIGALQLDNVQNYLKPQELRMGRVAQMNIGIAGVYYELSGVDSSALDVESRRLQIAENRRAGLTVAKLLSWVDGTHLDFIYTSHWLRILVDYVPELAAMKPQVSERFHTQGAKLRLDPMPTKVHSLSTSGKNETYTTEIKDGLVDFLSQIGQKDGGDGLTFQKLNEVKRCLQFHRDPLQSFEVVQPVLALWHTEWTNLSRLYETHQGSSTSRDPSCIGHSACQIGHPLPANVKKVDYHSGSELLEVIIISRILDCWRLRLGCDDLRLYFRKLSETKQLSSFRELELHSSALHAAYSTTRTPWPATDSPSPPSPTIARIPISHRRHAKGDRTLSNSIALMRDGILSMEFSYASAEGDVGRVYELLELLIFTTMSGLEEVHKSGVRGFHLIHSPSNIPGIGYADVGFSFKDLLKDVLSRMSSDAADDLPPQRFTLDLDLTIAVRSVIQTLEGASNILTGENARTPPEKHSIECEPPHPSSVSSTNPSPGASKGQVTPAAARKNVKNKGPRVLEDLVGLNSIFKFDLKEWDGRRAVSFVAVQVGHRDIAQFSSFQPRPSHGLAHRYYHNQAHPLVTTAVLLLLNSLIVGGKHQKKYLLNWLQLRPSCESFVTSGEALNAQQCRTLLYLDFTKPPPTNDALSAKMRRELVKLLQAGEGAFAAGKNIFDVILTLPP
ncbi:hypothetical protein CVT24_001360 [Panaeolus cyanescens]|uniref:DUF6589 domain-containing protein n=1 Tax=Panaeolus cyanescens TaxID=181874 RepID=A0A409WS63_9AGAR|nr:hypothetical protein CVT24_001360 [Panaeolus cyanescens]